MKRKHLVICLLTIFLLVWWLWQNHLQPQNGTVTPQQELSTTQSNLPALQSGNVSPIITSNPVPRTPEEVAAQKEERLKRRKTAEEQMLNEWRTPIEFYGKVVDENTNPVAAAQVDFDCNDISPTGTSFYHAQSDASGLFSIRNIQGLLLGVMVNKEGYNTYLPHGDNFYYAGQNANFVPDPKNPIVFRLRKKGEGVDLIKADFPVGIGQIAQLHHDGTPIELDLSKADQGRAGSGLLKLEFWRDVSDRKASVFDWKLQLSAPGGGLVETDEEFAFLAPENGYQPSIVIDMPATNQPWIGEIRSKYYIQLSDGKYGRIDFYFLSYNGVFTIHSAINPDGSRNLEPK
jgi:hypothetical protein